MSVLNEIINKCSCLSENELKILKTNIDDIIEDLRYHEHKQKLVEIGKKRFGHKIRNSKIKRTMWNMVIKYLDYEICIEPLCSEIHIRSGDLEWKLTAVYEEIELKTKFYRKEYWVSDRIKDFIPSNYPNKFLIERKYSNNNLRDMLPDPIIDYAVFLEQNREILGFQHGY